MSNGKILKINLEIAEQQELAAKTKETPTQRRRRQRKALKANELKVAQDKFNEQVLEHYNSVLDIPVVMSGALDLRYLELNVETRHLFKDLNRILQVLPFIVDKFTDVELVETDKFDEQVRSSFYVFNEPTVHGESVAFKLPDGAEQFLDETAEATKSILEDRLQGHDADAVKLILDGLVFTFKFSV